MSVDHQSLKKPFKECNSEETLQLSTHRFDLGSVQLPPVEHGGVDGVTCPGRLDGGGEHIQEVLGKEINS